MPNPTHLFRRTSTLTHCARNLADLQPFIEEAIAFHRPVAVIYTDRRWFATQAIS